MIRRCCVGALVAFFCVSGSLVAGPLDPPAGPIASTHKTLSQVEPRTPLSEATTPGDATTVFRITQPGSYYLTSNLIAPAGKNGIILQASNVSIDLAGFAVVGGGGGGTCGIIAFEVPNVANVSVRNGELSNWGLSGIDLSFCAGTLIEGILALENGQHGIRGGSAGVIRFCSATNNASIGIIAFGGGVIESCNALNNSSDGIGVGAGASVRGCVARGNSGHGLNCEGGSNTIVHCSAIGNNLSGINAQNSAVVESCVANSNTVAGIRATGNCLIRNNVCNSNGAGIHVLQSGDNRVEGNNLTDNVQGLDVDIGGNIIVRNTCSGNGTNWNIAVGNALAPIVSASTNGAAVSGNTYAGSLGNTDANANYSY